MVSIDPDWPFFFSDNLIKGNVESNVAICSLWTLKEKVTENISKDKFAIAGNLYYNEGINYLLRSVLSNPNIRCIVLCGIDISKSGETLLKLMENGISAEHQVIGTNFSIEKEIPASAIDDFRKHVHVIDMRNVVDSKKLLEKIESLPKLPAFAEPRVFPTAPPAKVDVLPSEKTGFVIRRKTISEAWGEALKCIMNFGTIKKTRHSSDMREIIDLVIVVEEEDPEKPHIASWLWFDENEIKNYLPRVMTDKVPEGTAYTYGNRLRNHASGGDQISYMIGELKKADYYRHAIAVTWQHDKDMNSDNPPCWVALQALAQDGKLFLTAFIRSNDMFAAWPLNAFGLRHIQKEIADSLGVQLGPLTTVSGSAHIYEHDWLKTKDIIENWYKPSTKLQFDPRGNFIIRLDRKEKKIIVDHYTPEQKKIQSFEFQTDEKGKTYWDIINKMTDKGLFSSFTHAADIGAELAKAEFALRYGLKYSQDDPLDLSKKAEE